MIAVLKEASNLLQPLSLVWLGLLVLAWRLWRQQQWQTFRLTTGLWVFLSLTTCLPFGTLLLDQIESPWRASVGQWDLLPNGDAIVCLGGGVRPSAQEIIGLDLQENSDRPTTAIELLRRGKAPRLLIGGGGNPKQRPEADAVKDWIAQWGLSTSEVISLGKCKDTHDEAEKVAALAKQHGWHRILLVTSASHMKRAQAVFQKSSGIEIIAVPCAFQTDHTLDKWLFLPSPGELDRFGTWFHEVIGWWVYRARGWI
jgi:uncharacterized SAM-binding protein YcdF (DUF218 family)